MLALLSAGSDDGAAQRARPADTGYRAPVAGPLTVVRGFDPPADRYGAGHLGLDLAVAPGSAVRSAGVGTVRFAGSVAGRGVVVVLHPDGISTEYEPLLPAVHVGQAIPAGAVLGRLHGVHVGCPVTSCLHWGARSGDRYVDPLSLLRPLGALRLVPWGWRPGAGLI